MPALKSLSVDAASVTGPLRRRVWKFPELRSHSLLVMCVDELRLAPLAGAPKPELVDAVEAGADLEDWLGSLATVVELASIRRVKLDLLTNSLIVEYRGNGQARSRLTIVFSTPEAADACFTKLWRRLGSDCELLPYKRDTWALARAPLGALALVISVTLLLAMVLSVFEDYASSQSSGMVSVPAAGESGAAMELPTAESHSALGWLDWRFLCGLGGIAAAGTQVWLYRRLTQPPVSLELLHS